MTRMWGRYRESSLHLWLRRPALWLVLQGLFSGLVLVIAGVVKSMRWTDVLLIWACVMIGGTIGQWWRGRSRAQRTRID